MSILADDDEKVSADSSNSDAEVCEHKQAPSDNEEIELEWTKEALTLKWYEEPEDCDRLCPADANMDGGLLLKDEARRVGLLLKEYDSLWMEQGWSSARKSSGLSRKTPPAKDA